jgi:FOG: Transposase and inactivated derivatives
MATKLGKKSESPIFNQIIALIPRHLLTKSIKKHQTDKHCSVYFTYDQLVSVMFGQLNRCLSLREICLGIDQSPEFLSDIGLLQSPSKSSMSAGNTKRNYKVFEDLYYSLLTHYKHELSRRSDYKVIEEIKNKHIKIVDATIMSVCLKLFSWAEYRTAKGGIKAHVSLDEASMLPEVINITAAKTSDRRGVDDFHYPKDTIVVDDRGYFDCKLFKTRIDDENHFVTRLKDNILYKRVRESDLPDDKDYLILKDEIIHLSGKSAKETGINRKELRRVAVYIEEDKRVIELITNNLVWEAATIAELYKRRWIIETFFKLIKQNLQIKTFLGTSPNACKSQIFIALICYLLLELIRRTISKTNHRFGHFVTLIRVCLTQYNRLGYIVNATQIRVRKARKRGLSPPNIFNSVRKEKDFEQLIIGF